MADATPGLRPRPISPAVGIWRWHITMVGSILHRVTGVGLYGGALILMCWALALASGPDAYGTFTALLGSILGQVVLFLLTVCVFYHLANGIRHLAWDSGYGFKPQTANATAMLVMVVAVVAAVGLWAIILTTGAS